MIRYFCDACGAELKESYWRAACNNLRAAVAKRHEGELWK